MYFKYIIHPVLFLLLMVSNRTAGSQQNGNPGYWSISPGQNTITWDVADEKRLPHADDIEMSGQRVSCIVRYEVDENRYLKINRDIIFPQLRRHIKSSDPDWFTFRAYTRESFDDQFLPSILLNDVVLNPRLDSVKINGKLNFYHAPSEGISVERTLFPSTTQRLMVEKWTLRNMTSESKILYIGHKAFSQEEKGLHGIYLIHVTSDAEPEVRLAPGESYSFAIRFSANRSDEPEVTETFSEAEAKRDAFLEEMFSNLVLKTPNPVLNTLFYFSKIRAAESIFESKMGLVHSPGGGNYYAGIWANDQVEYSGPFFPYLGYETGNLAAFNTYKHFLENIPPKGQPIKSSFEMEGDLPCCSKDRGDAAMIAFGTSQFVLASGDRAVAEGLWPLIAWSIDYCNSRLNEHGVVMSDTDEMEGRIPTGDANLSTSSLYYGGLIQAARVATILDKEPAVVKDYLQKAKNMGKSIENHFGATIDGIDTYRYFDGHTTFRHWICLPLVMGINERKDGTLKALFEKLWSDNGVLVEAGNEVFWDRGTLYAFRGAFKAGAQDRALNRLMPYSRTRLLGKRVPYVVEAYPEHGMRHLSAESALYCRVFTEGLLGIEPLDFNRFIIQPQIPSQWKEFSLQSCHLYNRNLSFFLSKKEDQTFLVVKDSDKIIWEGKIKTGKPVTIRLH